MTRGGLWLAAALLLVLPLDARSDDPSAETVVIQDASGRIVVVPAKSAAKRPPPVESETPAAREVGECEAHEAIISKWLKARERVIAAQRALEYAESIPLSGMGRYRDVRIRRAESELALAEKRESTADTTALDRGVPQRCLDDSHLPSADQ
ncbi:MAG: hypothetical protein WEF50_20925 [Myxococcota bacterium]